MSLSSSSHPSIILVGLNHHTAPVELRERFVLAAPALAAASLDFHTGVISECAILSTCNRLEGYALAEDRERGLQAVESFLVNICDLEAESLKPHLYQMSGADAIEHLMRVACGLESMMLGESQILGQVGDALDQAQSAETVGSVLSHLFACAIHAGKRARTETVISQHTTSISHAAAKLAQRECGALADRNIVIIGAGEMAELGVRALQMRGGQHVTVVNRSPDRARRLAQSTGARAASLAQLGDLLLQADVIFSATSASHIVLAAHEIEAVLPARSGRPLLVIDIAVPRDVDPAVGSLPEVRYFNIDDLQASLDEYQAQREAAVPQVEAIIEQEHLDFLDWLHSREVVPVISDLYHHAQSVVNAEIERALNKLDNLTPQEQKIVSQLGYRIANKLLHEPTVRLKAAATQGSGMSYAHLIRDLFALDSTYHSDDDPHEMMHG